MREGHRWIQLHLRKPLGVPANEAWRKHVWDFKGYQIQGKTDKRNEGSNAAWGVEEAVNSQNIVCHY